MRVPSLEELKPVANASFESWHLMVSDSKDDGSAFSAFIQLFGSIKRAEEDKRVNVLSLESCERKVEGLKSSIGMWVTVRLEMEDTSLDRNMGSPHIDRVMAKPEYSRMEAKISGGNLVNISLAGFGVD